MAIESTLPTYTAALAIVPPAPPAKPSQATVPATIPTPPTALKVTTQLAPAASSAPGVSFVKPPPPTIQPTKPTPLAPKPPYLAPVLAKKAVTDDQKTPAPTTTPTTPAKISTYWYADQTLLMKILLVGILTALIYRMIFLGKNV